MITVEKYQDAPTTPTFSRARACVMELTSLRSRALDTTVYGRNITTTQECPMKQTEPRYVALMAMMILDRRDRTLVTKTFNRSFFRNSHMLPFIEVKNPHHALQHLRTHVDNLLNLYYPTKSITIELAGIPPQFVDFGTYRDDGRFIAEMSLKRYQMGQAMRKQPVFVQMIIVAAYIMPKIDKWLTYESYCEGENVEAKGVGSTSFHCIRNKRLRKALRKIGARLQERQRSFLERTVPDSEFCQRYTNRILRFLAGLELEYVEDKPQIQFLTIHEREYGRSVDLEENGTRTIRSIHLRVPQAIVWLLVGRDQIYTEHDRTTKRRVLPTQIVLSHQHYEDVAAEVLHSVQIDKQFIVEYQHPVSKVIFGKDNYFEIAIFSALYKGNVEDHHYLCPSRRLFQGFQIEMDNIHPRYLSAVLGYQILEMLRKHQTLSAS